MIRFFLIFFLLLNGVMAMAEAQTDAAKQYIQLETIEDDENTDCAERGGKRVFVVNTHASQIIDLSIDRYFDGVRQGGRSMFALKPQHRQPLGCNTVLDSPQHWLVIDAKFISDADAIERYGLTD